MSREKDILTHSELAAWKDCPQRHEWRYHMGYVPRLARPPTLIGSAIHLGLEYLYTGVPYRECLVGIDALFNVYLENHQKDIEDHQPYVDASNLAKEIFRNYIIHWWGNDLLTARHPVTGELLAEFEFQVPIHTPAGRRSKLFFFQGKVDRIVEDEGEFWALETKTRDHISMGETEEGSPEISSSVSRLVFDQQARAYCYAIQLYLGIPIAGVIYDLVRRKAPGDPQVNRDGTVSLRKCDTTVDRYLEVLHRQDEWLSTFSPEKRKELKLAAGIEWDKYRDEIERLKALKWFDRYKQRYSVEDYRRVQMELYQTSLMMHQCKFPFRNDSACDHWGGCVYKPLCMGGAEPEAMFRVTENKHPELRKVCFDKPRGTPYRFERNKGELLDFDAALEAVNA